VSALVSVLAGFAVGQFANQLAPLPPMQKVFHLTFFASEPEQNNRYTVRVYELEKGIWTRLNTNNDAFLNAFVDKRHVYTITVVPE